MRAQCLGARPWRQTAWVWFLPWPLTSSVTLGVLPHPYVPQLPHYPRLKIRMVPAPRESWEDEVIVEACLRVSCPGQPWIRISHHYPEHCDNSNEQRPCFLSILIFSTQLSLLQLPWAELASFLFFKKLLIYFWLLWVFVAACRLSLAVSSRSYSSLQCMGFSLWWLLLLWGMGCRCLGFSSSGSLP